MAIEVELKAWVDEPQALARLLETRFRFAGSYLKEDRYYRIQSDAGKPAVEFRLRREGEGWIVTSKEKAIQDGVEVNREHEFGVSDGDSFDRFARHIGAKLFITKAKRGKRFRDESLGSEGVTIELSEVEGLGWFVEIECLVDPDRAEEVPKARERVRGLLATLGVGERLVEPRYYIDMLAELAAGKKLERPR